MISRDYHPTQAEIEFDTRALQASERRWSNTESDQSPLLPKPLRLRELIGLPAIWVSLNVIGYSLQQISKLRHIIKK